jgi:hypothetical protein
MAVLCPFIKDECMGTSCAIFYNGECSLKKKPWAGKGGSSGPSDVLRFGKYKGKTFKEVLADGEDGFNYMQFLINKMLPESIADPEKDKYKANNEAMLKEAKKAVEGYEAPSAFKEVKSGNDEDVPF